MIFTIYKDWKWFFSDCSYGTQVSISPAYFEHLFRMQVKRANFLYLHFSIELFWRKKIWVKAALKKLVKLTLDSKRPSADMNSFIAIISHFSFFTYELLSSRERLQQACLHAIYNSLSIYVSNSSIVKILSFSLNLRSNFCLSFIFRFLSTVVPCCFLLVMP